MNRSSSIVVTGAAGFIGRRVVNSLLTRGFYNIRCLIRPSSKIGALEQVLRAHQSGGNVEIMTGNLLSKEDCKAAARGVNVVYHIAAGRGEKSFADAFLNSVVTTRNLLDATVAAATVRRFVNISSFAVYTNSSKPHRDLLDEDCPVEERSEARGNAYCFAKAEQDKLVVDYSQRFGLPYVSLRPGYVCGPGNPGIHSRVGVGTFGVFLHLGGGNPLPVTYVDNCADAIALAGLVPGIEGEVFNVVDDDLPSSRKFLRLYKRNVKRFKSVYIPHAVSFILCWLWESYSNWSKGQLPLVYNRKAWQASWKRTRYSNRKLKARLGWRPVVPIEEALQRHFDACRVGGANA